MDIVILIGIFLIRFIDNLVIYFMDRNAKIPLKKVTLFIILQMTIVGFVSKYVVLVEPLFFFLYHYFTHRKDKLMHHIFFSQFPIIFTDLTAKLLLFFVIPFVSKQSLEQVVQADINIFLSYAFVLPVFLFLIKIFSIRNFAFVRYQTNISFRFLVATELSFLAYYLFIYAHQAFALETEWYHKGIVLVFFMILLYLLSFMNHYSKESIKRVMKEEERQHIQLLEQYNAYLETMYQGIRSFRHDYDNILMTLSASIESNDYDTINAVYQDIMLKLNKVVDQSMSLRIEQFTKIKNHDTRILIAMKNFEAQEKGVAINFDICQTLGTLPVSDSDLFVIVTVTGDLAILTAEHLTAPNVRFSWSVNDRHQLVIKIENQASQLRTAFNKHLKEQLNITEMALSIMAERNSNMSYNISLTENKLSQVITFRAEHGRFIEVK